jgi:RNA polymerase sigma-70 factor, ECF subfamily
MSTLEALMCPLRRAFSASTAVKRQRSQMVEDSDPSGDSKQFFDSAGRWKSTDSPRAWFNPEALTAQQQFREILQTCMSEMPPRVARILYLRQVLGESIEQICQSVEITESDCSAMLFDARLRLRAGLEAKWLAAGRTEH